MAPRPRLLAARIWRRIDQTTDPEGCWLWDGKPNGYDHPRVIGDEGKPIAVLRWLMEQVTGKPVHGRVHRRCGTNRCCRPAHLYVKAPSRG